MPVDHSQRLLAELQPAGHGVGELASAEERPELELHLGVVAGLLAGDLHLPAQLHRHGAHQDALAVRVRHRHHVVLAATDKREGGHTPPP